MIPSPKKATRITLAFEILRRGYVKGDQNDEAITNTLPITIHVVPLVHFVHLDEADFVDHIDFFRVLQFWVP
jgi:hypothetical protein